MKIRVDKYLHAVRIFKTRSIASDECRLGKVSVNGTEAKASREVKPGDEVTIRFHGFYRIIRIVQLLEKRVGAALVQNYYTDITPEDELIKKTMMKLNKNEFRPRGTGRPTKKERRDIDRLKER